MKDLAWLRNRPIVVAIAGPNGAGKTTFYSTFLHASLIPFVNADQISRGANIAPYDAAEKANEERRKLLNEGKSFIFETVFSDPVGDKVKFLKDARRFGFTVGVCFVGLSSADLSEERVVMRVTQGGHDVPRAKLVSRFPRTLENLRLAITQVEHVVIYDNSNLNESYRFVASYKDGKCTRFVPPPPDWLRGILPA